eukprot:s1943_g7.t2
MVRPVVALVLLSLAFHGAPFVGRWPGTRPPTRRNAGPGGVLPDGRLRDAYGMDMSMEGREGVLRLFPSPIYRKRLRSDGAELKALNEEIAVNFKRLMEAGLREPPLFMTDCWANVMGQGTEHSFHQHNRSTISGTYYVQTPRLCSSLLFEDPRLDRTVAKQERQVIECPAIAGFVVLFESWQRHTVPPNAGDDERMSVPLHSSARSQAMTNGETQVSSMTRDELLQFVAKLQDALSEAQRSLEQSRLACEAKDENMHQLIYDRNAMQTERDEARLELESLRTQHGVAHRSASQTSLPSAPQSMVVSPGLQPSSSAKCIKADAALPPVPNSWQPPQSARDGKCLSPVSPVSGGPEETEDGDMFPGPDFSGSYRAFGPMATVPQVPAVAPNPGRGTEKLVDILVTVPRANGPEDLDISNYEHFKDHRFHEPSRSLQSLQKNMQPPPPTVQRLPSAPVHSQAYPGQVAFPHVMHHPQFRIVTSASASVPSAPASLAAPAGGVRLAPRPSMVVPQVPANEGCRGDWPNLPSEIGALQGGGAQMARQSRQTQKTGEP